MLTAVISSRIKTAYNRIAVMYFESFMSDPRDAEMQNRSIG